MNQVNEPIENIILPAAGELSVYVARWQLQEWEQDVRAPRVMWKEAGSSRYLSPADARRFADALNAAADAAERISPSPR